MSRHKRHLKTLKKLHDMGWFVVMAKPAYRTGYAEVYLGVNTPVSARQGFVLADKIKERVRYYYAPPILKGRTMFVLKKWKGEGGWRAEIKEGWRELVMFASQEAARTKKGVS